MNQKHKKGMLWPNLLKLANIPIKNIIELKEKQTTKVSCFYKTNEHGDNNASASFTVSESGNLMYHCLSCGAKAGLTKIMYDIIFNKKEQSNLNKDILGIMDSYLSLLSSLSAYKKEINLTNEIKNPQEVIKILGGMFKVNSNDLVNYFNNNGINLNDIIIELNRLNIIRVITTRDLYGEQINVFFPVSPTETILSIDGKFFGVNRPFNNKYEPKNPKSLMPKTIIEMSTGDMIIPSNVFIKNDLFQSIENSIVFVEGEKDMLLLRLLGINAYAFLSGANSFNKENKALMYLLATQRNKQIIIISDNDKFGEEFSISLSKAIIKFDNQFSKNIVIKDISKKLFSKFNSKNKEDISDIFKNNINNTEFDLVYEINNAIELSQEINKKELESLDSEIIVDFYNKYFPKKVKQIEYDEMMNVKTDAIYETYVTVDTILDSDNQTYDFNRNIYWNFSMNNFIPTLKKSSRQHIQRHVLNPFSLKAYTFPLFENIFDAINNFIKRQEEISLALKEAKGVKGAKKSTKQKTKEINNLINPLLVDFNVWKTSEQEQIIILRKRNNPEIKTKNLQTAFFSSLGLDTNKMSAMDIIIEYFSYKDPVQKLYPLSFKLFSDTLGYAEVLAIEDMVGNSDLHFLIRILKVINDNGYKIIKEEKDDKITFFNDDKIFKELLNTKEEDLFSFAFSKLEQKMQSNEIIKDFTSFGDNINFGMSMLWTPRVIDILSEKTIAATSDENIQEKMWESWVNPIIVKVLKTEFRDEVEILASRVLFIISIIHKVNSFDELVDSSIVGNEISRFRGVNNSVDILKLFLNHNSLYKMDVEIPRWSTIRVLPPSSSPFFTLLSINNQESVKKLNVLESEISEKPSLSNLKLIIENNAIKDKIKPNDLLKIKFIPIPLNKTAKKMGIILESEVIDTENQDPTQMNISINKFRNKRPNNGEELITFLKRMYLTMYKMQPKFPFSTWFPFELLYSSVATYSEGVGDDTRFSKGALDILLVGDSQVGKSAVSTTFMLWYNSGAKAQLGETTLNAIIGGTEKQNQGTKIGAFAENNRKVYIIEELSGATLETRKRLFEALKETRKSGVHNVIRVAGAPRENIPANTRFIAISNPVSDNSDNTFSSIKEYLDQNKNNNLFTMVKALIIDGAAINRFNLISFVFKEKRDEKMIDSSGVELTPYNDLQLKDFRLRWIRIWSLKTEDVVIKSDIKQYLEEQAKTKLIEPLNKSYIKDAVELVPLITPDVIYDNVTRIAFAIGAMTCSFDELSEDNKSYKKLTMTKSLIDMTIFMINWHQEQYGLPQLIEEIKNKHELKENELDELLFANVRINSSAIRTNETIWSNDEELTDREIEESEAVSSTTSIFTINRQDGTKRFYDGSNEEIKNFSNKEFMIFNNPLFTLYKNLKNQINTNGLRKISVNILNNEILSFYSNYFKKENAIGSDYIDTFFQAIGLETKKDNGDLASKKQSNQQQAIITSIRGKFYEIWSESKLIYPDVSSTSHIFINGSKLDFIIKEIEDNLERITSNTQG